MFYLVLGSFIGTGLWFVIFVLLAVYSVQRKKKKDKKDFENLFK